MAAKKKTVQETRKQYVQAKIATNSASKNPAKLRQDFNTKAATVQGRTEIAQVLGVAGTPQAQMLRATLRNFPTASTGSTSTGKDKPVVTNRGYSPGIANNVNMPSNNAASSAVVKRVDPGYTPSYPTSKKVKDNKNVYGDTVEEKIALKLEQYKIPIFGRVAGIGRAMDAGKNKEAAVGLAKAVVLAAATGATVGRAQQVSNATKATAASDYYGSAAGSSSAPTPQSLIKQNEKELAKRAFNFYKNLTK